MMSKSKDTVLFVEEQSCVFGFPVKICNKINASLKPGTEQSIISQLVGDFLPQLKCQNMCSTSKVYYF